MAISFRSGLAVNSNNFGAKGEAHIQNYSIIFRIGFFKGLEHKETSQVDHASDVYRRSIVPVDGKNLALLDPENSLLNNFQTATVNAEEIRDSLLLVSGGEQNGGLPFFLK